MWPEGMRAVNRQVEDRRQEIKLKLAAGTGLGPILDSYNSLEHDSYVARFREVLAKLGPVFASFGHYLSSRTDILLLPDCVALAAIENKSNPRPFDKIRSLVQQELDRVACGDVPTDHFLRFDPEPYEARLLYQLHYGELEKGERVVVKLIHQDLQLDTELKLLPLLSGVLGPIVSDPQQIGLLIEDYRLTICESLNCRRTADALEALSHDARDSESLRVPKVYPELCTQHILITERLDGIRLDHYLACSRTERGDTYDSSSAVDGYVPDELARHLVEVWLTQAFTGSLMPIELRADQIVVRSSTEIAIVDGTFLTLPRVAKGNLLNYFCANAADEPSKALKSLLKEFDATHCKVSESVLDRQFRQVVAFRDGGWEDGGRANCLSDMLFAQWRLAARHGYRPLRHLAQTYRGTFHIAHLARLLAPQRDSFLEGVQDLRLTKLLHDIGTMLQPSYWGGQVDRLSFLPISIPGFLNDALWTMDNSQEIQGRHSETSTVQPNRFNGRLLVGLVLLAISLHFFDVKDLLRPYATETSAAVGFVAIGLWLIRFLTK